MTGPNGQRDVTIHAPPAVAVAKSLTPPGRPLPAGLSPEDIVAAQGAEIRELRAELARQELAASTFANAICCMAAMFTHGMDAVGGHVGEDDSVTIPRSLIDRYDGAKVAVHETGDRDLTVTITDRMD